MLSVLVDNHHGAHPFRRMILQIIIFTIGAGIWLASSALWAPMVAEASAPHAHRHAVKYHGPGPLCEVNKPCPPPCDPAACAPRGTKR